MFRISQFMRLVAAPEIASARVPRERAGPVVIWNLVRRCNLTCRHCYSTSADKEFAGELTGDEVRGVMEDLRSYEVPALILSGGEPLLRPDLFELSAHAKTLGFYLGLSSNGTLIDEAMADRIAAVGYDYVGVSIDGLRDTHDAFRRRAGAFDEALLGMRRLRDRGVKVGLRFTLTEENAGELPQILQLMQEESIPKFYLSHLNYAGRGNRNRARDAMHRTTRTAMEMLFRTALADALAGGSREFVTGNNDADGAFLLLWVRDYFPQDTAVVEAALRRWGGNASGVGIANIDNLGNVHPDTMWWHHTLGNVRERPFSEIWIDTSDPLMAGLKSRHRPVGGRCATCAHLSICGGNTRVRAQQLTGDPWAEDPGCYLTDEEVGVLREVRQEALA